jgi:bacillolysin
MPIRFWPLISILLSGCHSWTDHTANPATDGDHVTDPLEALEKDTGHPWTVRYHTALKTPAFLEGRTLPLAATPSDAERAGKAFLTKYRQLFLMAAPESELSSRGAESDALGFIHVHFQQKRNKIPVWGGELKLHFDRTGALVRVHGRYLPFSTNTFSPTLSPDAARVAAAEEAKRRTFEADVDSFSTLTPVLYYFPVSNDEVHLAFRVEVSTSDPETPMRIAVFVDATDGGVLAVHDLFRYLEGSGTGFFGDRRTLEIVTRSDSYYLEDTTRGATALKTYTAEGGRKLPGSQVKSDDPEHWDEESTAPGAAVDAHANLAAVWDYFDLVHGRSGWDGKGTGVRATVHFGDRSRAAFFTGRQLVFGDGDDEMAPPAAGLDLVAHEFTHGIVEATSGLIGGGPSGAVAEAICDLFASFIAQRAGTGSWQLGQSTYHPGGIARPIRDLADPHDTGDAAHVDEFRDGEDPDSAYQNSTILSHAGYLMTEGDALGAGMSPGLGQMKAERIWYRALAYYLTSHADFSDAADAILAAAFDLGEQDDAIRAAFASVGIHP